ncbi:hypothetical protein [Shewanella sp. NIFS-20-20]|uniref:hypothetical protein n=1 Tax=Shewanella sp. NIFS-20-20 TaxID=2853806 RepID=UPI001C496E51|nr:hypothetical protein [Shewanella sp. NIFS-20-20]MBV7317568.1 hypothetical protein [Shewanella sp. NIFS-20-20]
MSDSRCECHHQRCHGPRIYLVPSPSNKSPTPANHHAQQYCAPKFSQFFLLFFGGFTLTLSSLFFLTTAKTYIASILWLATFSGFILIWQSDKQLKQNDTIKFWAKTLLKTIIYCFIGLNLTYSFFADGGPVQAYLLMSLIALTLGTCSYGLGRHYYSRQRLINNLNHELTVRLPAAPEHPIISAGIFHAFRPPRQPWVLALFALGKSMATLLAILFLLFGAASGYVLLYLVSWLLPASQGLHGHGFIMFIVITPLMAYLMLYVYPMETNSRVSIPSTPLVAGIQS